ncbi:hypothetical protein L0U85_14925 [Glycomyces sp. L485]|uniref:hypothetical protein n=1 Tax=Glycomyces sp. L485 TaxID=2909235 RepID=UPI001F4A0D4E|nr:hypothetical protein [Glycomyces sp. L485]MCH7232139.1 hypothetical protein [Glycomyces sp. L485]
MKSILKALYNRLGRPAPRRLAAVLGMLAAAALVAVAYFGDARLVSSLSLLMSLVTIGALALVWNESRKARAEMRATSERTEVTYRRILAAIEVERLAAERRHARGKARIQEQNR